MHPLTEVPISPRSPEAFFDVLDEKQAEDFRAVLERAVKVFEGRRVWNVNSTARGGGVAEMLASLIAYAQGAQVDARWIVIAGRPDFFRVTKRIHNQLHGSIGDGGELGARECKAYEDTLKLNGEALGEVVTERDIVILHDPQTAGLIDAARATGAKVIWRCHVGLDMPNDTAREAWNFLRSYVEKADAYIFSRLEFAWEGLDEDRLVVVPPSIDAFAPKNQEIAPDAVAAILGRTGLVQTDGPAEPSFKRLDGSMDAVQRATDMLGSPAPAADAKLVVQVSRWDSLKDPLGVMQGFVEHVLPQEDADLILAGPAVEAVADDPEGKEVLARCVERWQSFDLATKERVHLAALPMDDLEENAAIVNALQRRADVVVQKSLAEGFGLTVAEAMWKARPVVASRIGGIQDQIVDGESGLLVDDPTDLADYGDAVRKLLKDPETADRMGAAAQDRVRERFLGPRHLTQYLDIIDAL